MAKRFHSFASIVLTSLIALLGFGSCKTKKQVIVGPPEFVPMSRADSIQAGLIPPPEHIVKPADPIRLVYGPPPTKRVKK